MELCLPKPSKNAFFIAFPVSTYKKQIIFINIFQNYLIKIKKITLLLLFFPLPYTNQKKVEICNFKVDCLKTIYIIKDKRFY